MKEKPVEISRRELFNLASPLGQVTLDKARCTGCGLCALNCPTGAMTFTSDDAGNFYKMLFRHGLCVACGQCVEVCPEHGLHLERSLGGLSQTASILFEDELVRCAGCGNAVGPKAMLTSLKARLPKSRRLADTAFELCPECKIKANFNLKVKTV